MARPLKSEVTPALLMSMCRSLGGIYLLWYCVLIPVAQADWVSLTGAEQATSVAEVYIEDDHVLLMLEIGDADLATFGSLLPSAESDDTPETPPSEGLSLFATQTLQLLTEGGFQLRPELRLVERRSRKNRSGAEAAISKAEQGAAQALYVELFYPLDGRPAELVIVPPVDDAGSPTAEIGFIAFHKGIPVIDYQFLSSTQRLKLDWEDPWYSSFDDPKMVRHHGSALMSFLYIEPYEVRHEVLIRVKDVQDWIDLGLASDQFVSVQEWDGVKTRIGEFLVSRNPVSVDGNRPRPILDRVDFVQIGLNGIQSLEEPQRLELSTAVIGVVIAYVTPGLPRSVVLDWDLFNHRIRRVPAMAFDPVGEFTSYVTPEQARFEWPNFVEDLELLEGYAVPEINALDVSASANQYRLPAVSIACGLLLLLVVWRLGRRLRAKVPATGSWLMAALLIAGGAAAYPNLRLVVARPAALTPALTLSEQTQVLAQLLKNVYRAFDFRAEEDVYDKLAVSVAGDLLETIYLQNRQSLAIRKAGGAQAKVAEVQIEKVVAAQAPERPMAFQVICTWTAQGRVSHWGHAHMRKNRYHARITVDALGGQWRITALDLLEEQRIDPGNPSGRRA